MQWNDLNVKHYLKFQVNLGLKSFDMSWSGAMRSRACTRDKSGRKPNWQNLVQLFIATSENPGIDSWPTFDTVWSFISFRPSNLHANLSLNPQFFPCSFHFLKPFDRTHIYYQCKRSIWSLICVRKRRGWSEGQFGKEQMSEGDGLTLTVVKCPGVSLWQMVERNIWGEIGSEYLDKVPIGVPLTTTSMPHCCFFGTPWKYVMFIVLVLGYLEHFHKIFLNDKMLSSHKS